MSVRALNRAGLPSQTVVSESIEIDVQAPIAVPGRSDPAVRDVAVGLAQDSLTSITDSLLNQLAAAGTEAPAA